MILHQESFYESLHSDVNSSSELVLPSTKYHVGFTYATSSTFGQELSSQVCHETILKIYCVIPSVFPVTCPAHIFHIFTLVDCLEVSHCGLYSIFQGVVVGAVVSGQPGL